MPVAVMKRVIAVNFAAALFAGKIVLIAASSAYRLIVDVGDFVIPSFILTDIAPCELFAIAVFAIEFVVQPDKSVILINRVFTTEAGRGVNFRPIEFD
jgi:hypothetical protein